MGEIADSTTSLTLLGRLRHNPGDQAAWNSFVERYGKKVYAWCRRWKLQEADACDVTQNVLVEISRQMSKFEYKTGGSFRGWLKTITYRAWCDFHSSRKRIPADGCDAVLDQLAAPGAAEDLFRGLEEECDRELLEAAMKVVQLRVSPHIWQAFLLTAVEEMPGAEVAKRLGMQVGSVWVARSKVQKFLREEVLRLEGVSDENPQPP